MQLRIYDTVGDQFRVGYDAANYAGLSVTSGGDLTITPSGGGVVVAGNVTLSGINRTLALDDGGAGSGLAISFTSNLGLAGEKSGSIAFGTDGIFRLSGGAFLLAAADSTGTSIGDIAATSNRGLVCATPDGTKRYRITVDNSGAITSTLL